MKQGGRFGRLFAVCMGIVLIAAAQSWAATTTITHLNYGGNGAAWTEFIKQTAAKYEALNPNVKIDVQSIASSQYFDAISVRAAGGVAVDVYELYPSVAAGYVKDGIVMDLTPFIQRDPDLRLDAFLPAAIQAFTYEGVLWGLPCAAYPLINIYNVDLYQQEGLPTPNSLGTGFTWDRFLDMARKLTKDKDGDGTIDQYGSFNSTDVWRWFVYVNQAGGSVLNRLNNPDKSLFTSPAARRGLQFLVDQFYTYGVAPLDTTKWAVATTFPQNKIGNVAINSPSFVSTVSKTAGLNYDVSALSYGPDNNATAIFMNSYQISSSSKNPQETWKWLKFLAAEPATVRDFIQVTGRVPVLKRLLPEYQSLLPGSPAHMPVLQEMLIHPKVQTEYVSPYANEIRTAANTVTAQVVKGSMSVEAALTRIHETVTGILAGK